MRSLLILTGAFALVAGAASAQFADPRTAAGAAGEITGKPAPDIDTPAKIDPSRDPAVNVPGKPLPQARERKPAETETTTAAPVPPPLEADPPPIRSERAEPGPVMPAAPPYLRRAY